MTATLDRVRAGEPDPPCLDCGGILKSATVSFGQSLDPAVLERARVAAVECATFLAVGTSLSVHPVAALAPLAKRAGARLVIVNASPTPYDDLADEVVRDPVGEALPRLVAA
jgi:NAD-dependent deacetylase